MKAISYPTIKFVAGNHKFIETLANFHYIEDKPGRTEPEPDFQTF